MPTTVQSESLIKLIDIEKSYRQPNGQVITIMEQINLELRTGEIVALLGPSGSGKSTLMRIITGLVTPTQGQVLYRQEPMRGLNPGAAIVFQSSALYPWLTVLENVELGLKAIGEGPRSRKRKALRMIDIIGLDGFESAFPKELSGGMRSPLEAPARQKTTPERAWPLGKSMLKARIYPWSLGPLRLTSRKQLMRPPMTARECCFRYELNLSSILRGAFPLH